MFTKKLIKENQLLIDFALDMHTKGTLLPDTYVIDVDQVVENGKNIVDACKDDITPIFMLKQLGRNPYIAKKLLQVGFKGAVAVDFKECLTLMDHNIPILNVGHLVQTPIHLLKEVLTYGIEHITVYTYEKAVQINNVAKELGIKQKLLLKIYASKETLYQGQFSGVQPSEVIDFAKKINELSHVYVDGLTTFPAFIYRKDAKDIMATKNLNALMDAKVLLENEGLVVKEFNLPSSNCVHNIPLARSMGATAIEPGHALSGTTMMNEEHDLKEKIAYLYLTEVSHTFEKQSFVYGGGYYARGNVKHALVTNELHHTNVQSLTPESIDYHLEIDGLFPVGSPVIMSFRTQMFVTRSTIALVEGLKQGAPKIVGLYDSNGRDAI